MQAVFSRKPEQSNMVTEPCPENSNATDMLCVECGWTGHATLPKAPWVVFMQHACKMRTESHSTKD